MRYLVTARVKPGREADLLRAIEDGSLGTGSVAGDEYLRNMQDARLCDNGRVRWVEYPDTGGAVTSSPAVAGGVVYVGATDGKLYAFDANGVTGCSGTPKTCTALWTAATVVPVSSPTVSETSTRMPIEAAAAPRSSVLNSNPPVCARNAMVLSMRSTPDGLFCCRYASIVARSPLLNAASHAANCRVAGVSGNDVCAANENVIRTKARNRALVFMF